MSANAGELLETMSLRLAMQNDGTTNPSKSVKDATRNLVAELSKLETSESIEVLILCKQPFHAQYIRAKTGKVLAEINEK